MLRYKGHVTLKGSTPAAKAGVIIYCEPSDGKTWWEPDPAQLLDLPKRISFDGRPASMREVGKPKFCREYYWLMNPAMLRWHEERIAGMPGLVLSAYALSNMPPEVSFAKLLTALKGVGITLGYSRLALALRDPVHDALPETLPSSDALPAPFDILPKVELATEAQAKHTVEQAQRMRIVK
jgi:hypothetical protein